MANEQSVSLICLWEKGIVSCCAVEAGRNDKNVTLSLEKQKTETAANVNTLNFLCVYE